MERARPGGGDPQRHNRCRERQAAQSRHHGEHRSCGGAVQRQNRTGEAPGRQQLNAVGAQTRARTSVPLVPPKPNELESATRIGILRAVFGT